MTSGCCPSSRRPLTANNSPAMCSPSCSTRQQQDADVLPRRLSRAARWPARIGSRGPAPACSTVWPGCHSAPITDCRSRPPWARSTPGSRPLTFPVTGRGARPADRRADTMTVALFAITWSAPPEPLPPSPWPRSARPQLPASGYACPSTRWRQPASRRQSGVDRRPRRRRRPAVGRWRHLPRLGRWLVIPTALAPYPGVAFVQASAGSSDFSGGVLPGQLLRAALPVRAADPAPPSPGRPTMTTALRLPNALAPWAEALEVLDAEVAVALGPIMARLDQLIDRRDSGTRKRGQARRLRRHRPARRRASS